MYKTYNFNDDVMLKWFNNRMVVVLKNNINILDVEIPGGFITDGATIPKMFWNILSPFGRFFKSCVLHDYICLIAKLQNNEIEDAKKAIQIAKGYRKRADILLNLSMKEQGINWFRRNTIMASVKSYTFWSFGVSHTMFKRKFPIEQYYIDMLKDERVKDSILSVTINRLDSIIIRKKQG